MRSCGFVVWGGENMNGKKTLRDLGLGALQSDRYRKVHSVREFSGRGSVRAAILDHIHVVFHGTPADDVETPDSGWLNNPLLVDVSIDGVELVANCRAVVDEMRMRGYCPLCGEVALSGRVGGFRRLGELLEQFQPDITYHACRGTASTGLCAEQEAAIAKATEAMREAMRDKD